MKYIYRILLSILLSAGIAAGCYFWATNMIGSNFDFRSPIKDTPPTPGADLGEPATRRVVIVLIDALRYDTSIKEDVMPTLAQLRQQGASAIIHSEVPSYSEPGYSTILTGAWPWVNDGPQINLDYADIPTFTQDNLFSAAHRAGLKTAISGYFWFEKLVPQSDVDQSFYTPGEDKAADVEVVAAALPWLQDDSAQLVLIHIDQVDYAGHHEGGAASQAWLDAAKRSDDMVAQIVAALDLSQDTIVILSDHGQIDAGGHGGQDPITLVEPFIIAGAGVNPGTFADMHQVDVAPTLAALLGTNLPASTQGQVLTDMLKLDSSVESALPAAVETQQTNLLKAYAAAIGKPLAAAQLPTGADVSKYQTLMSQLRTNREVSERIPRAIIAALVLAVLFWLLLKNFRKGAGAWIIAGLAFAALFNFRYAIWDHKTYSLSSVLGQTDLIMYVGITAAAALFIAWLCIFLGRGYFKMSPADAARMTFGLVFTTALLNGLPAILCFVINGPVVTWTVPNYLWEFLGTLSLIQVLIISAVGLLLAGLAALIAKLAANKAKKDALKAAK
jgi:hypothetical protein